MASDDTAAALRRLQATKAQRVKDASGGVTCGAMTPERIKRELTHRPFNGNPLHRSRMLWAKEASPNGIWRVENEFIRRTVLQYMCQA